MTYRYTLRTARTTLSFVVATTVLSTLAIPTASSQVYDESRGDSLFAEYKNIEALSAYRQALVEVETFDLLFKAGSTALLVGDQSTSDKEEYFNEAIGYAQRLRDGYPERPESWTLLAATTGKLAVFRGPREKARAARGVHTLVNEAIGIDSTYAFAHILAGILSREVSQLGWLKRLAASAVLGGLPPGSVEESRMHLEQAVTLEPDFIIARWEFAKTCLAMGREDEAMVHLKHIGRLSPGNSEEDRLQRKAAKYEADLASKLYARGGR